MRMKILKRNATKLSLKEVFNTISKFSLEFILLFSLFVISILLFYSLAHYIIPEKQNEIDNTAFLLFQPYISEEHTRIVGFITFFGTGSFLIPSYLVIIFYLTRKKLIKYAQMVASMVMSSLVLGWILKPVFHRPRPYFPLIRGAGGYSFPSGHALGGFIFSGVLLFLLWKTGKNIYLKFIFSISIISFGICIGLSRIYLHVHYATDVMGSLFIALAFNSASFILFRLIFKHKLHDRQELYTQSSDLISGNYHFNK
jgi:undecaprenyl-diphosphatase